MRILTTPVDGLRPLPVTVLGAALVAFCGLGLAWVLGNVPYEFAGGVLIGPVLLAGGLLWAGRAAKDDLLGDLVSLALVTRLLAAAAFFAITVYLYDGVADAFAYSKLGAAVSEDVGAGLWEFTRDDLGGFHLHGTGVIIIVTGALYALIGHSTLAAFLVFSLLGFVGHYLFYRAYRTADPDGDAKLYGLLVLFTPSLVFWTAPVGKDAWMALFLGMAALGAARVFTRTRGGYRLGAVGLVGGALVRPHLVAILVIAAAIGLLVRRASQTTTANSRLRTIVRITAVVSALVIVAVVTARFFRTESAGPAALAEVFEQTTERTTLGGSSFTPPAVSSPDELPAGAATVLFRPYLSEADNPMMLLAGAEGLALMALVVLTLRRPRTLMRALRHRPYVAFAGAFTVGFIIAFSYVANFGILVRQRTMTLPFLFAVVAATRPFSREAA